MTGLHNQLRWQTQLRLARELGFDETGGGIAPATAGNNIVPVTTPEYDGDFREGTIGPWFLNGKSTVIAVVKKNAVVLRRLRDWLKRRPLDARLPVLLIDDEADQASINTGGERHEIDNVPPRELYDFLDDDLDTEHNGATLAQIIEPSVINGLIREIRAEFSQAAYVAYTATPFANVLIDPAAVDLEVGEGLYPRDFIMSLPVPANYVGADQLFGSDPNSDPIDVVSSISEVDASLVSARSAEDDVQLADSLREALRDFLLAAAAKDLRIGTSAATMLVHTTYRIAPQAKLGSLLEDELGTLRYGWKYDAGYREELQDRWESEFESRTAAATDHPYPSFEELSPSIDSLLRGANALEVVVFNSASETELGFDRQSDRKIILVGGNRLARGLTLEGLLVSYFTRQSGTYDTVMQAARWFGYHDDYQDLTRIWLTDENYSRFRHLAKVEDDLFRQISLYELTGKRPTESSPLILSHPEMQVTASNKLGAAEEFDADYSGHFIQSVRLPLDNDELLQSNLEATRRLFNDIDETASYAEEVDRLTWRDVPFETVAKYLSSFETYGEAFNTLRLLDYITRMATRHQELVRWWVSVRARRTPLETLGTIDLGGQVGAVNAISRSRLSHDPGSLGALASPVTVEGGLGDETVGLDPDVVESVRRAFLHSARHGNIRFSSSLRSRREPEEGLLCIYPVSAHSKAGRGTLKRENLFSDGAAHPPVIGLAVLFPPSKAAREAVRIGGPLGGRGL